MAAAPGGAGYWLVDAQGAVSIHGSVSFYGSMAGQHLNAPIDHIVATPDGGGYWLVAADGGIFTFGDTHFYGSMGGQHLNAPVVDIAPTSDGGGYWLVASDGGVFSFGDAVFRGSMGGNRLNRPVVGISPDNATGGYWLVASDGGVFSYRRTVLRLHRCSDPQSARQGDVGHLRRRRVLVRGRGRGCVRFRGRRASRVDRADGPQFTDAGHGRRPAGGYWLVASDGGVFSFGAPFFGAGSGAPDGVGACARGRTCPAPPCPTTGAAPWRPCRPAESANGRVEGLGAVEDDHRVGDGELRDPGGVRLRRETVVAPGRRPVATREPQGAPAADGGGPCGSRWTWATILADATSASSRS